MKLDLITFQLTKDRYPVMEQLFLSKVKTKPGPIPMTEWIHRLEQWRANEDSVIRAENALMRYYLRTARPQKQFIPEIMAA